MHLYFVEMNGKQYFVLTVATTPIVVHHYNTADHTHIVQNPDRIWFRHHIISKWQMSTSSEIIDNFHIRKRIFLSSLHFSKRWSVWGFSQSSLLLHLYFHFTLMALHEVVLHLKITLILHLIINYGVHDVWLFAINCAALLSTFCLSARYKNTSACDVRGVFLIIFLPGLG